MNFMVVIVMSLTVIAALLGALSVIYADKISGPSLKTRLLNLGLDECKKYVRDIAMTVGATFLYCDFVLTCDFALTFRETCRKAVGYRRMPTTEVQALEDQFVYAVEAIRILRDDGDTNFKSLEIAINKLCRIRTEMQDFVSKLSKNVQPC